jgi:hypothetical protein
MSKLVRVAQEAVAIASGDKPAPRIWHAGHAYVPERDLKRLEEEIDNLEQEACFSDDDARKDSERRDAYYSALSDCADRYETWTNVDWFRVGIDARLPLEKLNRWLGFLQGTVIAEGHTTVDAERDWTRPLFHPLDFPT